MEIAVPGVANAIRDMSDEHVLAAIDQGKSLGIGDMLQEAAVAVRVVERDVLPDVARQDDIADVRWSPLQHAAACATSDTPQSGGCRPHRGLPDSLHAFQSKFRATIASFQRSSFLYL